MRTSERIGAALGAALAPVLGAGSLLRRARIFHPEGVVCHAVVRPLSDGPPFGAVAARLAGRALLRLSSAWWRGGREWPDVLGCAVRFSGARAPTVAPHDDDQDLLFATVRWPFTLPFAPLRTDCHDFLANDYYAVSPFDVAGVGRVKWRLVAPGGGDGRGGDRTTRLDGAIARGAATLRLEARPLRRGGRWTPVALVELTERLPAEPVALRFSPFRAGRGIAPRGLIHAMRAAAYALSQRARGVTPADVLPAAAAPARGG